MSPAGSQAHWSAAIVGALEAAGVEDVVVSPGSRSTPLVLALHGRARVGSISRAPLRVRVAIDERSAGFFALGIARYTLRPVALVCTSGSAGSHYLPAFVEAYESAVPLVAITADRPPELHGSGASQTTDQSGFLSSHSLTTIRLDVPQSEPLRVRAMANRVADAIHTAVSRRGPIHINAPFRKPFEPELAAGVLAPEAVATPARLAATSPRVSDDVLGDLATRILDARSGLIVAGPVGLEGAEWAEQVQELAAATGFALLAESTSQLRDGVCRAPSGREFERVDSFDHVLRSKQFRAANAVDLIVRLGRAPVSKWFSEFEREHTTTTFSAAFDRDRRHDPNQAADVVVLGDVRDALRRLTLLVLEGAAHWTDADRQANAEHQDARRQAAAHWSAAGAAAWDATFAPLLDLENSLADATVARTVAATLPDGGALFVGNSLPVREFDWFCSALPPSVGVVSQRGVAGIDGAVAGTLGVAAVNRGPTTALIGDVTFLHDVSALQLAKHVVGPTCIVVINNDGGRIFERLPIARREDLVDALEPYFTTPHGHDICALASGFGVATATVRTTDELSAAVLEARERGGVTVVQALVDPAASERTHRAVFAAVTSAVDAFVTATAES